jgi:hypothetical protein
MKIIDDIKDFDKIKVGYTVILGDEEKLKEILSVDYGQEHIVLNDKTRDEEYNTVRDIFECQDVVDVVFPCSLDQVQDNFPEYFI